MVLVLVALVVGGIVGLALGGRPRNLANLHYRWWSLAVAGFALQVLPVPHGLAHGRGIGAAMLVASYVLLAAFVLVNIRAPGFPIIAVGLLLNALVITVNAGMPVTAQALRAAAGTRPAAAIARLEADGGAKHHLAGPSDELVPLSDRIGIGPPVRGVFSVGDVLWMLGAAWAIAGGMLLRPTAGAASGGATPVQTGDPPIRLPESETLQRDPAELGPSRPSHEKYDPPV